jgi:hypothetical protein
MPPELKILPLSYIMRYTTALSCLCIAVFILIIDLLCKTNLMTFCDCKCKCVFSSSLLPLLLLTGAGLLGDYIQHLLRKRELQKVQVYKQTIFGINHLVRNLQSKFIIISNSESIKKEFGTEIVDLLNQSSKEMENTLEQLALLKEVSPEMIQELAFSK